MLNKLIQILFLDFKTDKRSITQLLRTDFHFSDLDPPNELYNTIKMNIFGKMRRETSAVLKMDELHELQSKISGFYGF